MTERVWQNSQTTASALPSTLSTAPHCGHVSCTARIPGPALWAGTTTTGDPSAGRAPPGSGGAATGVGPGKNPREVVEVVVFEDADRGAAQAGGVHEAGMHEFVEHDGVVLAEQRADGAERGGVARGKGQGGFGAFEGGEGGFEFVVGAQGTAEEPGSA